MIQYLEAVLLFKKWRDEKTSLLCQSSLFSHWGFSLRGTVEAVDDSGHVYLRSSEGAATVSLQLTEVEGIEYGEVPGSRTQVLIVVLPLRVHEPLLKRDKLTFMELQES